MGIRAAVAAICAGVMSYTTPAMAQWTPPGGSGTVEEPRTFEGSELYRQTAEQSVNLPSVEFGDSWNQDTGEVSFSVSDIGIPGNNDLPVGVARTRSRTPIALLSDGMFGDWELSLPRIEYTWRLQAQQWFEPTRCRSPLPAAQYNSGSSGYQPYAFYFGMTIHDLKDQSHLIMTPDSRWPATSLGTAPALTTKTLWKISCLPAATNGRDGFLATAPDGTTYRFDREIHRRRVKLQGTVENLQISIYPSVVTDVHGNTINFTYGVHGPTRIQTSDGRIVDFIYNVAGQVTQVTSGSRTWNYIYEIRNGRTFLARVQQPDGHEWRYEGFENLDWANYAERDYLDCQVLGPEFGSFPRPASPLGGLAVVHPNGTRLESTFALVKNGRSKGPPRSTQNYWYSNRCRQSVYTLDNYIVSLALSQKRIVQTSGTVDIWNYSYSQDEGSYSDNNTLQDTKLRTEVRPDGTRAEYDVFRVNNDFREGEVVESRIYSSVAGGTLLERSYSSYEPVPYAPGYPPLPASFGSQQVGVSILRQALHYFIKTNVLERGGDVYTTAYTYTLTGTGFALDNPTTIQKSSNTGSGARTSNISYLSQTGSWVLFKPLAEVLNGVETIRLTYSTTGKVNEVRSFGVLRNTLSWNADGTMAWAKDALNRQTTFSSYKRGTPQLITQPDGTSYTFVVDGNGWITSATNPRGHTTQLGYNAAGWLTSIDRPVGWFDTAISYSWDPYGIAVTQSTGNKRTVTTHDGLNRPILVRTDDLSGVAASVYQKTGYDGLNRVVFQGLPAADAISTAGANLTYDALGREIQVTENVAPFATTATAYLSGNRVQVTDPVGNQTITTKVGFGGPDDGFVTRIDQPLGVSTVMTYGALGNMLTATQGDAIQSFTQTWAYDSQYRLCAQSTPETGTKRFEYDAANQLVAYAEGLTGTTCATLPVDKVQLGYDLLGRATSTNFPGTTPDITTTYDANSNVTAVSRGGVNWTYAYNSLDRLTQERLQLDGRTYQFDYSYNGNGELASATVPFAGSVTFGPDGFGRPTGLNIAGNQIASLGAYFPNGNLKQMSYGNGLTFTATQNARQLTATTQAISGGFSALGRSYTYDANGRVSSIVDSAVAGENRSFTYDGLGRLATASGPWGAGSYTYDGLGNLKSWTQGSSSHSTVWDTAKNRPTSATTSGYGTRAISYDARGNVSMLGGMAFTYDYANQPETVTGSTSGTYTYDGNLKRVKQVVGGQTIYNVYSTLTGNVSIVDNATTGERNAIVDLGTASVRWNPISGAEITHLDHLGSPVAATSWQGGLLWRESYTPFGDKQLDPAVNRDKPSFTGHIDDGATGLTYMQARYYDPALGRFLSADPVGVAEGGVAFFNRYAYVGNDPINGFDPTGMYKCIGNDLQCEEAKKFYNTLVEARDSEGTSKRDRRFISRILKHIGAPGKGDVEVSFGNLGGDSGRTDTNTGNIKLDLDRISGKGGQIANTLGSQSNRAGLIAGASTLAHEGRHSLQVAAGYNFNNVDVRFEAEVDAYWIGNVVTKAFGGTNNVRGLSVQEYLSGSAFGSCVGSDNANLNACGTASINWNRKIEALRSKK